MSGVLKDIITDIIYFITVIYEEGQWDFCYEAREVLCLGDTIFSSSGTDDVLLWS